MNIVVISPTYNERNNVLKLVPELKDEFKRIKHHTMQVLFVDDSSPDGTANVIKDFQKHYPWVRLLERNKKEGLGAAYAAGIKHAIRKLNADAVIEFDADFQHDPKDIKRLVAAFDEGYDYVIASRYVKGGSIPKEWGFNRKFLSVVGNLVARVLLLLPSIHDVTTGFKLTRVKGYGERLKLSDLISRSFAYKVQLLYEIVKMGAKVKEVPINFLPRNEGESKLIKNEMNETLRVIFVLQSRNPSIRRFIKFGIVGAIGFIFNSIALEIFSQSSITKQLSQWSLPLAHNYGLDIVAQPASWAGALAAEVAVISNFILNNLWTFRANQITSIFRLIWKFLQFNATSIGAVIIQFIVIGTAVKYFGDTSLVRQLALISAIGFLIIPYNYFMYTRVIWRTHKKAQSELSSPIVAS